MSDEEPEEWRPVVGWEGLYEVSSLGKIRSLDKRVNSRWGKTRKLTGKIMKTYYDIDGYPCVTLKSHHKKNRKISRLVAEAFLEMPRDERRQNALHWDDDKTNNRVENLRWGTREDNVQDSVRNNTHSRSSRTHCRKGHEYTEENTYIRRNKNNARECRTCIRGQKRDRRAEKLRRQN